MNTAKPSSPVRIVDTRYQGVVKAPMPPMYPGTDGSGAVARERLAQDKTRGDANRAAIYRLHGLTSAGKPKG